MEDSTSATTKKDSVTAEIKARFEENEKVRSSMREFQAHKHYQDIVSGAAAKSHTVAGLSKKGSLSTTTSQSGDGASGSKASQIRAQFEERQREHAAKQHVLAGGLTKKTKAEQIAYESKADSPVKAVEAEDHEREVGSGPLFAGRNGGSGDSGGGERGESEDSRGESVFGMFGSVPRNVLPQVFTPVEEQSASPQQSLEETSSTTPAASAAPTEVPASSAANTAADAADAAADDAAADDASGAIITVPVGSPATTAPAEPSITGPFVTSGISWVPEGIGGHYALYHIRVTPQRANAMTVEGVTSRSSRETPCLSEDDSKPFTVYHRFQDFKVLQVKLQFFHPEEDIAKRFPLPDHGPGSWIRKGDLALAESRCQLLEWWLNQVWNSSSVLRGSKHFKDFLEARTWPAGSVVAQLVAPPLDGTFVSSGAIEVRHPNAVNPYERIFDLLLCQTKPGK